MTVGELGQRMSSLEFTYWMAYYTEKARREAPKGHGAASDIDAD